MAYEQFVPLTNMNFQINRIYNYGELACKPEELWEIAPRISTFDFKIWYQEWDRLGKRAEAENRIMHAAYYYRLSEFFLPDTASEKQTAYENFKRCFYKAVDPSEYEFLEIPYQNAVLPVLKMASKREKGVILLHGGFDSFIEEFYLELRRMPELGYTIYAFEGPGQGRVLRQGLKMNYQWEKPVSAIIDKLELDNVGLIGVSLGGYLALRAAAFEKRISHVVCFDVIWDALAVFTRRFPDSFRESILAEQKDEINLLVNSARKSDDFIDWIITHGMYITGTESPFEYLYSFKDYHTRDISQNINQDVLLLAGENDHFVPPEFLKKQEEALVNARSVSSRMFTETEGADQHCQVGNSDLVVTEILDWLNRLHSR